MLVSIQPILSQVSGRSQERDKRGVAGFSGLKLGTSGSELSEIKIYSTASIVPTAVPATGCLDQNLR